ncbi:hypothetical protein BWI17_15735 [Betaproteobacteria bacterium GR16-43]|nr:hypothetical protein BWI17_15735 [Betaproteobacteria bacterium GR16-43]
MIKKHGVRLFAVALIGAAGMIQSGGAVAAEGYGCACLHNNIQSTIKYRFRWGDRDWRPVTLAPGAAEYMCWAYKDAPKSPELQFQLDTDLSSEAVWKTFSIKRAQSKEASCSATPKSAHYHVGYLDGSHKKKIRIFDGKS